MALIRRAIHVAAWIGTLLVGLLALALIVSQTPWFRDWLRRTIIREARQYVNGELTIGQVTGNLFFDFGLADVARTSLLDHGVIDMSEECSQAFVTTSDPDDPEA